MLESVADVDAGGADLHAHRAVDAVSEAGGAVVGAALARPARLAALHVVGDDQGVAVEHRALEAGVGAHVDAHLLAQPPRVPVGREPVEQDPEGLPRTGLQAQQRPAQLGDGREVADEGKAGPQRERDPHRVLGGLERDLARAPGRAVELHLPRPVSLDLALDPEEDLGVHGLGAGVAAPQPSGEGGEEEEGKGGEDQQEREVEEVLRIERPPEDVEPARRQVEEQELALVPAQPAHAVEEPEQSDRAGHPHGGEPAVDLAWVDLPALLVERGFDVVDRRPGPGRKPGNRDLGIGRVHGFTGRRRRDRRPEAIRTPRVPAPRKPATVKEPVAAVGQGTSGLISHAGRPLPSFPRKRAALRNLPPLSCGELRDDSRTLVFHCRHSRESRPRSGNLPTLSCREF